MSRFLLVLLLFACLFMAACGTSDKSTGDNDGKFGGFYGGINGGGGMAR